MVLGWKPSVASFINRASDSAESWPTDRERRVLMSAVQDTERYIPMARFPIGHQVLDSHDSYRAVDYYSTRCGAEYAARLLNSGLAVVNHHGTIGCRVMPV